MLSLYFIRHGETDFNKKGIVQGGGIDSSLNETGFAQGNAFFEQYQDLEFEGVYCSELQRTAQTLSPWHAAGYEIQPHAGLNEFNWGELEGKEGSPEIRQIFRDMTTAWTNGHLDIGVKGGESPEQAWKRTAPFFEMLFEKHKSGKVLICSHGRILRIILCNLLGHSMRNMQQFDHHNTGLYLLHRRPTGNIFTELMNDTSHLKKGNIELNVVDYRK